ncbi:BON domain-containing protein [Aestuariispira insulae]|uniref:Osmotically-inducible protein OsmY n=1 Tax=Aestuariispira insulae TaxID=1461337 RepID=A0A3D9HRC3_9PROT|nr:BON domain-containing protein [Aestuariispira insulae]RED51436.1 osmotically-inducible protein OsmY [Aestuariispira insulae]
MRTRFFFPVSYLISLAALLPLLLFVSGCTPIGAAIGAGATAGSIAMEERSFSDSISDREIAVRINKRYVDNSTSLFANVNVDVVEGRVLLTGAVADQNMRIDAARLAWQEDGVSIVINEIQVTPDGDIFHAGRDAIVKTKLVAAITLDRYVQAVNYEIAVTNGTVYLFGIAQNRAEVDRVIAHARTLAYVRRIIDHMQMVDAPERLTRLAEQEKANNAAQ